MTKKSEYTEVQTLDALIVNAQTADDLIAETLRNEVICATFSKTLKSPTFATLTQIEGLERFFETFAAEAKADYVDDTSELERPLQASWRLQNCALQHAVRTALATLPAHIKGNETDFSAFIPMGPVTDFRDGAVYIPGYHITITQEGLEACLWTHTLRARTRDIVCDDIH